MNKIIFDDSSIQHAGVKNFKLKKILVSVFLFGVCLWSLLPIYWCFLTSIKSLKEISSIPPSFFTTDPRIDAWVTIFDRRIFVNVFNSIIIATLSTFFTVVAAVPGAYAITRLQLPSKFNSVYAAIMGLLALVPPISAVIPLFYMFSYFGLIDTKFSLILIYTAVNTAFAVWVLRGILMDVPLDAEEAALIDGNSRLGAMIRIVLPSIFPSIFSVSILLFIFNWNEYVVALFFSHSYDTMTVPIGIQAQIPQHELDWGIVSAAGTLAIFPVIIAAITLQKYLIRGLTFGISK